MSNRNRLKLPNITERMKQIRMRTAVHIDEMRGRKGIRIAQDLETKEVLWLTDRFTHAYILGATGSGKTTLLRQMIEHDMQAGYGVGVLAKENEQIQDETLPFVPRERIQDTVYLNPQAKHPLCINPLELPKDTDINKHVGELVSIFSSLLGISAYTHLPLCRAMLYVLVLHPEGTIQTIPKFLGDDVDFRKGMIRDVESLLDNDMIFEILDGFDKSNSTAKAAGGLLINRFLPFMFNTKLRKIMCGKTTLNIAEVMRNNGIFIANLSDAQDVLGEDESNLLGAYLITVMKREMNNRQAIPKKERANYPFMLYIDEFTKYLSEKSNEVAFEDLLTRARRNFVALHLAHQDTANLSDILETKLGGVGARIFLKLAPKDAAKAVRSIVLDGAEGDVKVSQNQLTKMTKGEGYIMMYHEDTDSYEWHHVRTFPHHGKGDQEIAQQIIDQSSYIDVESETSTTPPNGSSDQPSTPKRPNPNPKTNRANTGNSEPFEDTIDFPDSPT